MHLTRHVYRLTVLIGEDDYWHHKPLYHEIVTRARETGLAGATVLRGCEGYGATGRVHTTRSVELADNLPIAVVIVDSEDRIRGFLPLLDELVTEGMVCLDEVDVLRYTGKSTSYPPI
jgi:PII-like signaling protein